MVYDLRKLSLKSLCSTDGSMTQIVGTNSPLGLVPMLLGLSKYPNLLASYGFFHQALRTNLKGLSPTPRATRRSEREWLEELKDLSELAMPPGDYNRRHFCAVM